MFKGGVGGSRNEWSEGERMGKGRMSRVGD